jgi:ribosomal-protein-alanine N-acetyltransferase
MHLCPANEEHRAIFSRWKTASRLEETTCRPIVKGKRIAPDDRVVTLSFFHENFSRLEPVGRFIYFDLNSRNRSTEFGYFVSPDHRNQGIGTTMLTFALDHLFATTDLNKLYCQTAAFNVPSVRLLEKLNFHKDGILREHHELDGTLWDDYVYSMLRREWTLSNDR